MMTMAETTALVIAALACVTDLRSARIPNLLTFGAILGGLLFHGLAPAGGSLPAALAGLLAGLLVFFPFFALGALGAGDVKLMAALGTWLGWQPVIQVALFGALAGGVLALVIASWRGYLRTALQNLAALIRFWAVVGVKPLPALTLESGTGLRLPYALPIMVGLVVTLWRF
jgi:prepilin peptidase CpaA